MPEYFYFAQIRSSLRNVREIFSMVVSMFLYRNRITLSFLVLDRTDDDNDCKKKKIEFKLKIQSILNLRLIKYNNGICNWNLGLGKDFFVIFYDFPDVTSINLTHAIKACSDQVVAYLITDSAAYLQA